MNYIDETSLNLSQFTLRSSQDPITSEFYSLTNTAATLSFTGTVIVLQLSVNDQNLIKARRNLATSNDTTFLEASTGGVRDMNTNELTPIPASRADPVLSYTPDTNRPSLMSFNLNVNTQSITLSFNETIDSQSVDLNLITLQQDRLGVMETLNLTNGTVSPDSATLVIVTESVRFE